MPWAFSIADDIGGRSQQQDRVAALAMADADNHLLVLADGMGGHRAGAEAAQLLVDTASRYCGRGSASDPGALLQSLCLDAHGAVVALGDGEQRAPGSTGVLLYVSGAEAYWAHVGDSRLYFVRQGQLVRQTVDHSVVALRAAQGLQAQVPRNTLYMCFGGSPEPQPVLDSLSVESGDLLLLCSDGFWEQVPVEEAITAIGKRGLQSDIASELVQLARLRGGRRGDNISLALAQWTAQAPPARRGFIGRRLLSKPQCY